jgi:hypothetical protein
MYDAWERRKMHTKFYSKNQEENGQFGELGLGGGYYKSGSWNK